MHREVRSPNPGSCPKCGMALVPEESLAQRVHAHTSLRAYMPLIAVTGVILAAVATVGILDYTAGTWSPLHSAMHLMAGYFLAFGTFKLIDLPGFASGFSSYDIIAARVPAYGYLYPFIEILFGLCMLAGVLSLPLLYAQLVFMGIAVLSVTLHLSDPNRVDCLCLGTVLKVPLTTITLLESSSMLALTAYVLALY